MSSEVPIGAPPPVLLHGHLHPGVLLLRLLEAIQRAFFPLLIGVLVERWFLALAGFLFLAQMLSGLLRYLTFQFTLTSDELVTREGLLSRQERRIPVDRIQDLGFESTILRRLLGLVVVQVETASGKGAEATLDSLGRLEAEHLREVLQALRAQRPASSAIAGEATNGSAVAAEPAPEWLLHRASGGQLLLRGITDLRIGAWAVSLFAVLQIIDQFGLTGRLQPLLASASRWLESFSPVVLVLLGVGLVVFVLGFGVTTSALANLVMFHGFQLSLRGDVLQRRYGLLTTRSKTLPRRRVQRVLLEQNWLRRLLGLAAVRADSAGGGMDEAGQARGGWDVVLPLAAMPVAESLLPALLPGVESETAPLQPASPRLILRVFAKGTCFVAIALAASWPFAGKLALLWLIALPLLLLAGLLLWRNVGWSKGDAHLVLQWGILGRYRAVLPFRKLQSVILRSGPLQRLLGLCTLTVYVAGGMPSQFDDLPAGDAARLRDALALAASRAAGVDWR